MRRQGDSGSPGSLCPGCLHPLQPLAHSSVETGAPVWLPGGSAQPMKTLILTFLRTYTPCNTTHHTHTLHTPPPPPPTQPLDSGSLLGRCRRSAPGEQGGLVYFLGHLGFLSTSLPAVSRLCSLGIRTGRSFRKSVIYLILHQTTEPGSGRLLLQTLALSVCAWAGKAISLHCSCPTTP